jgi:membrane protein
VSSLVDRVDGFQRRHRVVGVPLAIVYKYFDDQGPYLAAILTYYALIAIFPLMLLASSILGFVLQGNTELQDKLLNSALTTIPIVGSQLGRPEGLTGSTSAIVVGALAALYGTIGVGQAAQHALNTAWAVPRNSRLDPITSRLRGFVVMVLAGVVLVLTTLFSSVAANLDLFGLDLGTIGRWASILVSIATTAVVLSFMMRYTTSRRPGFRTSLPGGIFIAVGWHVLQIVGGVYVERVIGKASEMNGVFALVLGLMAFLFIACIIAVLGIEVSVVLRRKLYPRALLTPFTDAVELTDADRRAYDSYAKSMRHKGFQHVEVHFDDVVEEEPREAPHNGG